MRPLTKRTMRKLKKEGQGQIVPGSYQSGAIRSMADLENLGRPQDLRYASGHQSSRPEGIQEEHAALPTRKSPQKAGPVVSRAYFWHRVPGEREPRKVYGGMSVRFWMGEPGRSDLYIHTQALGEMATREEQESLEAQTREAMAYAIARQVYLETSLEMLPTIRERLQVLMIWRVDDTFTEKIQAFEYGLETDDHPGKVRLRRPTGHTGKLNIRDVVTQYTEKMQKQSASP